jgi:hypothetical protein
MKKVVELEDTPHRIESCFEKNSKSLSDIFLKIYFIFFLMIGDYAIRYFISLKEDFQGKQRVILL